MTLPAELSEAARSMVRQGAEDVQLFESLPLGDTYRLAVLPEEPPVPTVMLNALSELVAFPSLTLMTMFELVPTFELEGVPES
jgi:hypothetical protein